MDDMLRMSHVFKVFFVIITVLINASGCAKNHDLSPASDSEVIGVIVRVPKELVPDMMGVMYRSVICKKITHGASGQRIELEGYHKVDMELLRKDQSDLYTANLPINGGGSCEWRLSSVMLGMKYSSVLSFGKDVIHGSGIGVGIKLDHNRPPISSGIPINIEGDLHVIKGYYPWIREGFIGGYKKRVGFIGQGGEYVVYQALQAREIYFEPVLHSDFIVRSAGPRIKEDGSYSVITYPDGSVSLDGRSGPSFQRLEAIRLNGKNKQ